MAFSKIEKFLRGQFDLMSWQDYQVYRFRQARKQIFNSHLQDVLFPCRPGLVSVFLPDQQTAAGSQVGQPGLIAQTYTNIEAIPPGDHLHSQPVSGEFLAWLEPECLQEPTFIQQMVTELQQNPGLDSVTIRNKVDSSLPPCALLVRSKIAWLMGGIPAIEQPSLGDPYWRQANLFINMKDPNLSASPGTGAGAPLNDTTRLCSESFFQVQADFSRDFFLSPWLCFIQSAPLSPPAEKRLSQLKSGITQTGTILFDNTEGWRQPPLPKLWTPTVFIGVTENPAKAIELATEIPENSLKVLVSLSPHAPPSHVSAQWDICCTLGNGAEDPIMLEKPWQGWITFRDVSAFVNLLDVRVHVHHYRQIEHSIINPDPPRLKISVIICTYHRGEPLREALQSVAQQTLPLENYEVIIVNNDPADEAVTGLVDEIRDQHFRAYPEHLRLIPGYLTGLSYARNAGISEAIGEILCFLDDDALASNSWLEQISQAFVDHPELGVVGGHIHLIFPEPRPKVLRRGRESYWGELLTPYKEYTQAFTHREFPWGGNWCARKQTLVEMGGFRGLYGRRKRDFSGGEEFIAASLALKLGYTVALLPAARVDHKPDPSRFTYQYLKNTIIAGIITQYRMGRDFYLPQSNITGQVPAKRSSLAARLSKVRRIPSKIKQLLTLEYIFYLLARVYLLSEQTKDTWARFWHRI